MTRSNIGNSLAKFVNLIFHPLLMPTFAAFIFFNSNHFFAVLNKELSSSVIFIFFILSCITPAMFIHAIRFFKLSSNKNVTEKSIRIILLVIIAVLYVIIYYYMQKIFMPAVLLNIISISILIMLLSGIISIFWKISLYSCAIGGLVGYIFFLVNILGLTVVSYCFLSIIAAGTVATSRLYLGQHNPSQIYWGLLLGFAVSYCFMFTA